MEELFSSPSMVDFPLSLHLAMVEDTTRVQAFLKALRSVMTPGCTVVDVGSGTGILALLAARHGAGKVLGLERSDIVRYARKVKAATCPDAPVTFARKDILLDELPKIRADIVVCELLGNFGIEENMIEVLEKVRRDLLKPHGTIIPNTLDLMAAPVQCAQAYREITAWNRPRWGIDFSPLQELAFNAVYQLSQEPIKLLAAPGSLTSIDFMSATALPRSISARFTFSRRGTVHGFAGWFRARLSPRHVLESGPGQADTHWGQVLFPIGEPVAVERGGVAEFSFSERNSGEETRWSWSGSVRRSPTERRSHEFSYRASRRPHYEDE